MPPVLQAYRDAHAPCWLAMCPPQYSWRQANGTRQSSFLILDMGCIDANAPNQNHRARENARRRCFVRSPGRPLRGDSSPIRAHVAWLADPKKATVRRNDLEGLGVRGLARRAPNDAGHRTCTQFAHNDIERVRSRYRPGLHLGSFFKCGCVRDYGGTRLGSPAPRRSCAVARLS